MVTLRKKKCPVCESTRIVYNELEELKCNNCGYENLNSETIDDKINNSKIR